MGPIPAIIKWFRYIQENESEGDVLGWNKSNVLPGEENNVPVVYMVG